MNSISLREFIGENVVIDCEKFVYIAFLHKASMDALSLRPIQQTDTERYGFDPRVIYVQRNSMYSNPPMISYGQMPSSMLGVDNYHIDDSRAYQQAVQTTTWTTSWGGTSTVLPVENTPEQYGLLRRAYNRIGSILMYEL
ncbi:MAG: hypothetical protein KAJ19_19615 [Gammaproteobacteria bacterium]|nr:hypothetical protein [Gammaproteobacteria bacterium]